MELLLLLLLLMGLKWNWTSPSKMAAGNVVHSTVHLCQHPLLLSLWDATKPHSISRHAHGETLAEAALLAAVPIDPHYRASLILQAFLVLDILLDAASEKALATFTSMDAIMKSRSYISTDLAQKDHTIQLGNAAGGFARRHPASIIQCNMKPPRGSCKTVGRAWRGFSPRSRGAGTVGVGGRWRQVVGIVADTTLGAPTRAVAVHGDRAGPIGR